MKKKNDEITIRSSAAEYLTYVASVGDQADSVEMRYEDENIWLTQKMMATVQNKMHFAVTVIRRQNLLRNVTSVIQDRLFLSDFDKYILELEENTKK